MNHYWRLVYGSFGDLSTAYIPPEAVSTIQRRWDEGKPIHLDTGSVPANQIREFAISDRPFGDQRLLEEASQAMHSALLEDDGAIQCRWVKQTVTQDRYNKHYSHLTAYKHLNDDGGMTTVAFLLPTHTIDQYKTPYCTTQEIQRLTSK